MKNQMLSKQTVKYTSIPTGAIRDLSFVALGLYAYITSKPDGWEGNIVQIADEKQLRKSEVKKAYNELKNKGWLV
ncbi:hypothetical protein [Francisella philomiragia]|uniref:Helix-turn-helix domain protein n=1 Tax=Francisella philomiragia TaxID=28110 RepID=A0A0B6CPQ4_9GAMM|nr:hypothetical protein [Francisella philomiragia]AJI52434.1 helix-turn-helix domain protein [Francisella philomiragia]